MKACAANRSETIFVVMEGEPTQTNTSQKGKALAVVETTPRNGKSSGKWK